MNQGWRGKESIHARLQAAINKTSEECNGKFIKSEFMDFLITAALDTLEFSGQIKEIEKKMAEPEKLKPKAKRFVKPCRMDIDELFASKGVSLDEGEKFFNYYESNGWKVGKNPMKNWKAAAANWMKGNFQSGARTSVDQSSFLNNSSDVIDSTVVSNQQGFLTHEG